MYSTFCHLPERRKGKGIGKESWGIFYFQMGGMATM
jgi:hypothetical protein